MSLFSRISDRIFSTPLVKEWAESTPRALARQGPLSATLAETLRVGRATRERAMGSMRSTLTTKYGWLENNPNFDHIVEQMDIGTLAPDPTLARVGQELSVMDDVMYQTAQAKGIKVAPKIATHFPRMYPENWFDPGAKREEIIQQLVTNGHAATYAEAERLLSKMQGSPGRGLVSSVPTLESRRRTDIPGWRRDFGALVEHLEGVAGRSAEADVIGPNGEYVDGLLSSIKDHEGRAAYDYAKQVVNVFMHRGGLESAYVGHTATERNLASIMAATKLGLAVIGNATQGLNNVLLAGLGPSVRGLREALVDWGSAKDFALRSGAIYGQSLMEMRHELGLRSWSLGEQVLRGTGFSAVEQFNRVFSSKVGEQMAIEASEMLARRPLDSKAIETLRLLDLDPSAVLARGLTQDDILIAAKRVSDLTQFRSTVLELPLAWRKRPEFRLLTLYKNYAFNQTKFIKDYVWTPATKGELRPLIYFATLFPIAGEIVADVKSLARHGDLSKRPDTKYAADRIVDNYLQLGSLGILADMMYAMSSSDDSAFWRFVGGPILSDVSDMKKVITGFFDDEEPFKQLGKQTTRRIPTVGPLISETLYPPKTEIKSPLQKGTITKKLVDLTK